MRKFVKKHKITYPTALDTGNAISTEYKLVGHPMTYYISADGVILDSHIGAVDEKMLEEDFEKLFF